ncbi:hypothetical protein FA13DRAFT_1738268 [Coprinellus micaceus]|uniref:Uncharacterized protein n=1 Tax=Coprinellus micaceus TaxID=71717 RepID=A0A4Y7SWD7_COPMI|nr:hypothetical protein FA13DRAFT_1738268 [Coprinellus micaceus]
MYQQYRDNGGNHPSDFWSSLPLWTRVRQAPSTAIDTYRLQHEVIPEILCKVMSNNNHAFPTRILERELHGGLAVRDAESSRIKRLPSVAGSTRRPPMVEFHPDLRAVHSLVGF